jgi:hypothetical protein
MATACILVPATVFYAIHYSMPLANKEENLGQAGFSSPQEQL